MERWVEDEAVVGAEILIIKNRQAVLHDAVGWKDREREIPWEKNTVCRIRSMTKPFVGTAILMLADDGKLSIDDPVSKHIASFDNERSDAVTVRHLLTHTGGFTQPGYPEALGSYSNLREAVDAVGTAGPSSPPGTEWIYSDAGSATLGAIVAQVSGMAAEQYIRAKIVEPLGLSDTFLNLEDDNSLRPRVSSTYQRTPSGSFTKYWDSTSPQVMQFFRASGGMYSTTHDYARFLELWMDLGRLDSTRLFSPETARGALETAVLSRDVHPYGFQWQIFNRADTGATALLPVFGHGGSDGTIAWAVPAQDLIVVYFTQSRGGETTGKIREMVEEALR
jgi:CubicO group peptidase (beta-lactamase class C family)